MNYIVSSNDPGKVGGSKAKEDIIKFSKKDGFISFKVNPYHSKLTKLYYTNLELIRFFKNNRSLDNVIIQYPIPSKYMVDRLIANLRKKIKGKLIIWVHDIQGLQGIEKSKSEWEINLFNKVDFLVVHNSKMKEWLITHGIKTKMIILGIFDYDNPQPIQPIIPYKRTICFAGNLFKSTFLEKINIKSQLFVFGPNMPTSHSKNVIPSGVFSPEKLGSHLNQNFGLIWDGPCVHTCCGTFGNYLLYNNPHKTSLYISSGLPVIIWNKAALSDFVRQEKIGITISDLENLDNELMKITNAEYNEMKKNAIEVAKKLRNGFYTHQAINKVLND